MSWDNPGPPPKHWTALTGPRYTVSTGAAHLAEVCGFVVIDEVYGGIVLHARFWRREDAEEYAAWKNTQGDPTHRPSISWYTDEAARQREAAGFQDGNEEAAFM